MIREWKEKHKWINKGWKEETNKIRKDGRESSENCKYSDKSFCLWLSQKYPLVFGEYRAMFFLDVGNDAK